MIPAQKAPSLKHKTSEEEALGCLMRIARAIAGQLDCPSILKAFANELSHLISYDHVDLVLLCPNNQDHYFFETGLQSGWQDFFVQSLQPIDRSPVRSVLRGFVPYLITGDATTDPRFHFSGAMDGPIFESNLRSRIALPMLVHGQVIGSLNISSHQCDQYDEDSVGLARYCADLLSPYVYALTRAEEARTAAEAEGRARATTEQMRLGALNLTQGMENERKRLAMDLHDQTLGDLAHLARKAAKLRMKYGETDGEVRSLELGIVRCLSELRRIVEDLKPGVLSLFGFSAAVEAYLESSVQDMDAKIATLLEDRTAGSIDQLEETIQTALYRILQESINNAVRHSKTDRIEVSLKMSNSDLVIEIRDYGVGGGNCPFDSTGGIGHIQTRASLIGAKIDIFRTPNSAGTTIEIRLPQSGPASNGEISHRASEDIEVTDDDLGG